MITKSPYVGALPQSVASGGEVGRQGNPLAESSTDLSLFIYDEERDVDYYDCVADDGIYQQHSSQLRHVSHHHQQQQQQQQACSGSGDGDEDATVKLQLLANCGAKSSLEYPWMRDKRSSAGTVCVSNSMSGHRLKQCLTSDSITQSSGRLGSVTIMQPK